MTSPSTKSCDKNYIILVTNGLPNGENMIQLGSLVGDYDKDGMDAAAEIDRADRPGLDHRRLGARRHVGTVGGPFRPHRLAAGIG